MEKFKTILKLILNKAIILIAHLIPFLSLAIPKLEDIQHKLKKILKNIK